MNKKEICAALVAAGIAFDGKATVDQLKALCAENGISTERAGPSFITVRVTGQRICEDGIGYNKGETFDTTPERAAAIEQFVEVIETPAAE